MTKVYKAGTFGGKRFTAVSSVSLHGQPRRGRLADRRERQREDDGRPDDPAAHAGTTGSITFDGADVSSSRGRSLRTYYATVQGVFQDPFSSYNPIFKVDRVFELIRRPFLPGLSQSEWNARLHDSLEAVALEPPTCSASTPTS